MREVPPLLNIREALIISALTGAGSLHPENLRSTLSRWGAPMAVGSTSKTLTRMMRKGYVKRDGYEGWWSYKSTAKATRALKDFRTVAAHAMPDKPAR